ncbi:CHAT domain-containing protein [Aliterella atlantica]|uniref:CHAT domain-containing protein n=1 Tax=Aliterella atlantica TaxID=1827278 RepID=UPI0005D3EE1F|nr:tetratricopeptide repeat protein [Aliterella atlantica]
MSQPVKKLLSSLLTVSISLASIAVPPTIHIASAQTRSPKQELEKLLQQSVKYTEQGQFQQAVGTLQQALVLARQLKDKKTEGEILAAINLISNFLAISPSTTPQTPSNQPSTSQAGNTQKLLQQGIQQTKQGQPQQAIATFEQVLALNRQVNDKETEATALLGIGLNYNNIGQTQKALDAYNRALDNFKAINNRSGQGTVLSNIGEIYRVTGQSQKALEFFNLALLIFKEVRSRSQEANTLNSIGIVYSQLGQKQKALEFFNSALPINRAVGDTGGEANTLNSIGELYKSTGQPQKALESYNLSLSISKKAGNSSQEAVTQGNLAGLYLETGQPQKALEAFNSTLVIFRKTGDRYKEAATLNNIGAVYRATGETQKALDLYNQALSITRTIQNSAGQAIALNNIAGIYLATGQPQKALEFLNQSLPIVQKSGDRAQEATVLNNIGEVYNNIGQPQKALEFYNQALPIVKQVGDTRQSAILLNNIGGVYNNIGQPKRALEFYNQALPIFKQVGDRSQQASTLSNIGVIYAAMGESQKALAFYNQALPILKEVKDISVQATTLSNVGEVYRNLGQQQKALEFYNQALPIRRKVGDLSGEATTLNNIGLVYYTNSQPDKALTFYNQALPIANKIGDASIKAATLGNVGVAYRDSNRPTEAIENLEQAVEITLQVRKGLERANRQQFLDASRGRAIGLIDLLIDQKQPERAYQWVNLTTTADLADYSRLIDAKVANPQAQQAIEKWNQSNQRLESLRQQLQTKFSVELSAQINQLQAEINQQAESISRQFPEVAELFETTPQDVAKLRANIPANTVVVQPVLLTDVTNVPNAIALFVITKDKLTVTKQKLDPALFDQLVTQYRSELTDARFPKRFRANSSKLYDILIRPIEAQIQAANPQQLSIIATGKLRYIPFETLIDSKTGKYLIEKYPVNNLTRLSSRALPQTQKKSAMLALGNPSPGDRRKLAGAEQEVESITPILPGSEAYIGDRATLSNFKNQSLRFPILHLATHGCFQTQGCPDLNMEANTLLFSDRNLNIADAALLGLKNTDLVVLSACQTAVQAKSNGEEFAGMAYLFERAGADSVIASLWLAKDEETKELMIAFYENLKQGKTKGEALRQAKLSLIDKHPLYWSPFILIGDAS